MGQYWLVVNLDKREYVHPHKLGTGLKLWEQLANHPGTGAALIILCAAMPEGRGGGDFDLENNWHGPERVFPAHNDAPGPMPGEYMTIAKRTIGRWAGERIALVGDYAEPDDIPGVRADLIYSLCSTEEERGREVAHLHALADESSEKHRYNRRSPQELRRDAEMLAGADLFRDISDDVAAVIEHELQGKFGNNDRWRQWKWLK